MTVAIFRLFVSNCTATRLRRRDSSVGIATGYGLDGREVGVRVPVAARVFFQAVQTGSGSHPASYPMGAGGKATGA
jgi:hypothetical protein